MYIKHHTKGIIISGKAEGSDSRRVEILTENFGLLSARVQGSRNINSKLRSGSQDFAFGEFSLVHGKSGWRVVSVRSDKNLFEVFRNDSLKLKIAGNILNLIKKLVAEDESQSSLFSIVSNFLYFLEKAEKKNINLAECLTLMRILYSLGYMVNDPELSIPVSSSEIQEEHLEKIAPRRLEIVKLINESLKAT